MAGLRVTCVVALGLLLASCWRDGDDDDGSSSGGGNRAPTANAGGDRTVSELTTVSLNGSGTDANGDPLSYSWQQTAGIPVSLTGANTAAASFLAPDVIAGSPEVLTFELTVSDGRASATDAVIITVQEPAGVVSVSGRINYEFVPPAANCRGLDFNDTIVRPVRGATVQLIDTLNDSVLASTVADGEGNYAFAGVDAGITVRLRVRAELKKTAGTARWDVDVRDNVDRGANPPPLQQRPLYVIESGNFDTGSTDVNRNLTATSGWTGSSYGEPRAAAPFAILDTIYAAIQFVLTADPDAVFPPLDAFWSVDNSLLTAGSIDIDAGELPASFYSTDPDLDGFANPSLFLLGDASDDTEEFDDHVIAHEWGHYFEDNFSRSDSPGGGHSIGDRLDPRLAFGEGWATAFAAMALDNPLYCDTGVPGTAAGFGIGAETGSYDGRGWYDEISALRFIYDLYDTADDGGADTVAIGWQPIFDVLTGEQAASDAFTTVFSFAAALRESLSSADQLGLDAQLVREDMTPAGLDIWGTNELNDAGGAADVMPIYTDLTADGSVVNVCSNGQFDNHREGNKLAENRFLRVFVPATGRYDVSVVTTTATPATPDPDDRDQSDPDIYVYGGGAFVTAGTSPAANEESFRTPLLQGGRTYVAAVEDWRFDDAEAAASYPDRVCMNVSFSPTQ
jgi:hypothetical protein